MLSIFVLVCFMVALRVRVMIFSQNLHLDESIGV